MNGDETRDKLHSLAIVMRKGGSGKTTLSAHLAVAAALDNTAPVGLIDTDPQGSLQDWWNKRADPSLHFTRSSLPRLSKNLEKYEKLGVRLAIVDTPPTSSKSIARVVEQVDMALIPVRPSPHDLPLLRLTADVVRPLGKPIVFVINAATRRARITSQAISVLSQYGLLAPTIVHNRVSFASSMIDGRTAMEVSGADAAADEIVQIWDYLKLRLYGGRPNRPLPRPSNDRPAD